MAEDGSRDADDGDRWRPGMVPEPSQFHASESGRFAEIAVEYRRIEHVVGGTINNQRNQRRQEGSQTQIADEGAIDRASRAPSPSVASAVEATDQPHTFIAKSAIKFARAKVEPTERSMPPTIITETEAHYDQADLAGLPAHANERADAEEMSEHGTGEDREHEHQKDHRNRSFG